ncbi:MAG: histidine kinase [Pseudomonadota bacterium]
MPKVTRYMMANRDFWQGVRKAYVDYDLGMSSRTLTTEQVLLDVSGLLAIALVGYVIAQYNGLLPSLTLHIPFALVFLLGAYKQEIPLIPHQGIVSVLLMFLLSVVAIGWFRDTIVLILSVVMIASAPYHLSGRLCWLLIVIANVAYGLLLSEAWAPKEFAIAFFTLLALQGFALTSSLARQREVATRDTLARQNNELLAARAVMAQQSQAEERLRIAGDLHDTIGHRLTALQLQLEALAHQAPESLSHDVKNSQALAADLLEDIRSIVRKISEEKRGDLAGAIAQLEKLTPGVKITVSSSLPELETPLVQQLVFCFQEAFNNAIRHGGADRIDVSYDGASFLISDNGRGLRGTISPGFGLNNIRARLAPFGGRADLSNSDTGGCELVLQLQGAAL